MFHSIQSIAPICLKLHANGRKLVLATGFFDLLHAEHIKFLGKAKTVGDILIVAIESDARAHAIKGPGRPVETQSTRCQHVADLRSNSSELPNSSELSVPIVDFVITLPDDFDNQAAYASLLAAVRPHIYAVSSHTSHLENKRVLTEKYGGRLVVVHEFNPEVSTTQLIAQNDV